MSKKEKHIENTFVTNAPLGRRLGAIAFDALTMIITFILLSFVIRPIMNAAANIDTLAKIHETNIKKSHLVYLSHRLEDNPDLEEVEVVDRRIMPGDYAKRTYLFYTDFMFNYENDGEKYTHDWYLANILKVDEDDSLFTLTEESEEIIEDENSETPSELISEKIRFLSEEPSEELPSEDLGSEETSESTGDIISSDEVDRFLPSGVYFKEGVSDEKLSEFNYTIYVGAIRTFDNIKEHQDLQMYVTIETLVNLVFTTTIFYLLIPIFTKNGQTLGKMIFKLYVCDAYGFKLKWWQLLVRYLAFLIFEIFSWFLIPVLGMFVSLTMMTFSKKGRALHDFIAVTRVVSAKHSTIYDSIEELEYAQNVIQSREEDRFVNEEVLEERIKEDSGA